MKKEKNSRKRLNSLILLVAFTAIMLIVSTYAWFSVQNDVLISGITGTVNSVEGMMVSLDGTNWTHELELTADALKANTNNLLPEELLPVSTTATAVAGDGVGLSEVAFYRGDLSKDDNGNEVELSNIRKVSSTIVVPGDGEGAEDVTLTPNDATYPGYYAIDLYVQNASEPTGKDQDGNNTYAEDVLQLNSTSTISVSGETSTGLQNTVRLGLASFSNSVAVTSTGTAVTDADYGTIADVAIWEPNSDAHVDWIVQKNNLVTYEAESLTPGSLTANKQISTFALTSKSVGKNIANIYNWDIADDLPEGATDGIADDTGLMKQVTVKTAAQANDAQVGVVKNLMSVDGTNTFKLAGNQVVKLRVYLWLEGQDVDTINNASHGKGVTINLGLTKGATAQ